MRLISTNRRIHIADIGSQTELFSSVSALADCIGAVSQEDGKAVDQKLHDLMLKALTAAHATEAELAEQRERIHHLEQLAATDELTGLMNRRGFESALDHTLAQAQRYGERGILAYVDLDEFKPINDQLGHAAGDAVLRHVGQLLIENTRGQDFVGRLGGDEFGLVLVRSDWDAGLNRIEVLDRLLNSARLSWGSKVISIKASIGVQAYDPSHAASDLLQQADKAMYQTKQHRADLGRRTPREHGRPPC